MSQQMNIAIEVGNPELDQSIMEALDSMAEIKVQKWHGAIGEKGELAIKDTPDIIIIDDDTESEVIFKRLSRLRHVFPQAAVFVVSDDTQPEHIVEVMKAGATEYLVTPLARKILINSMEEIRAKLTETGKIAKGQVYSFVSSKGGLGSTILSVNTAVALAQGINNGRSVALCDMSFQSGDASVLLDTLPETTIIDICRNFHRLDVSLLKGAMIRHDSGLELLAAPVNPEEYEEIKAGQIEKIIKLLIKFYDRVVIDCQSMTINPSNIEIFRNSQKIFIVIDCSLPAIRNAVRITQLIRKTGIPDGRIEFILNRYEKGAILSVAEAEKSLGKRIYWLIPNNFSDIMSSINEGRPIVKLAPSSLISRNIMSFSQKILNKSKEPEYRGAKSSFGRYV
jgi:pilus assembly protein CpaE